jgi:ribosomal protein S18 acetylase RimI-like enzyme
MAAVPDIRLPELVDLWQIRAANIDPLLDEEVAAWRDTLDWDFRPSADLVRRFVDVRALGGYALLIGDRPAGYCYFVSEDHKGLIGDLFVRARFRTADNEHRLLAAVIDHLMRTRRVRRIESQLMLIDSLRARLLPGFPYAHTYLRNFMVADLRDARSLSPKLVPGVSFDRWAERRQDESAQLIASAYRGHIDSEINDQYRSPAGARRFLFNIVQYPGCGSFFQPASWAAAHADTGRLCGLSLTSMVAPAVGHVTQICVSPAVKGKGVGYELLRHSLQSLAASGARRASLTVTAANEQAIRLYEHVGFHTLRQFPAFVWEGF